MKDLLRVLGFVAAILVASFILSPSGPCVRATSEKKGWFGNVSGFSAVSDNAATVGTTFDAGAGAAASGRQTRATVPVRQRAADAIAAKVNGEPICWGEVRAGIGSGMFGSLLEEACHDRLERLINSRVAEQYLKTQHVEVAAAEVDKVVSDLQRNPPPAGGCPCCSFNSLDAYLAAKFMTVTDLRTEVRINLGMDRHVEALWNAEYPAGEKRQRLLETERPRIEKTFAKVSHIFFNIAQQMDYADDPDGVRKRANTKAHKAWQELQKGAVFAAMANRYSEDTISREKGGGLGCVPTDLFGKDAKAAIDALKPGEISQPVESPWGCHIFRREALTDQDVLEVLKSDARSRALGEIFGAINKGAKIERFD